MQKIKSLQIMSKDEKCQKMNIELEKIKLKFLIHNKFLYIEAEWLTLFLSRQTGGSFVFTSLKRIMFSCFADRI